MKRKQSYFEKRFMVRMKSKRTNFEKRLMVLFKTAPLLALTYLVLWAIDGSRPDTGTVTLVLITYILLEFELFLENQKGD